MATTDLPLINRAHRALSAFDEYGDLSGLDLVKAEASGLNLGAMQRQYLLLAGTLALVSIAESLEAMAERAR